MNFATSSPGTSYHRAVDDNATLQRLIGNLRGFFYRRRHDAPWTMDFLSVRCRDVTGYDPHRFIGNASIAFADLILEEDRSRVNEQVRLAVLHRRRITLQYRIRAAHGMTVLVEDRLAPVIDGRGQVLAIEGICDLVCAASPAEATRLPANRALGTELELTPLG